MARRPRKRRFRKSFPSISISIPTIPRCSSRPMTCTKTFRFSDLIPELRDLIYTFVLQDANKSLLKLVSDLPPTAKALRQVSRAVGAEYLAVYYFKNSFTLDNDCRYMTEDELGEINRWISVFGGFAVHHLRSIRINLGPNDMHGNEAITINLTNAVRPVTWDETYHSDNWLTGF